MTAKEQDVSENIIREIEHRVFTLATITVCMPRACGSERVWGVSHDGWGECHVCGC